MQHEAIPVDGDDWIEARQRLRHAFARNVDPAEELEVPERPRELGIDVDDDAVAPRGRERDLLRQPAVRTDRRMAMNDRAAEVAAHDDEVHAGVRPWAG